MTLRSLVAVAAMTLSFHAFAAPANTAENGNSSSAAFTEAQKMLGTVPSMLKQIPEAAVPGAWAEMRDLQMGKTSLSGKTKDLIGLAVAAQIPCRYCLYFHGTAGAELNGITDTEKKEAIAISALARHWSTFFNGLKQDERTFLRDLERMNRAGVRQSRSEKTSGTTSGATSSASNSSATPPQMVLLKTPEEVYRESKKMWGFVPEFIAKFPREGIVGAWNEYTGLMMNPNGMISMKDRTLISLAVASQIPCSYCVTMDKSEAKMHNISETEVNEAIAMAAMTRHWSTILNGSMMDEKAFRSEVDGMVSHLKRGSSSTTSTSKDDGTTSGTTQPIEDEESQDPGATE